MHAYPNQHTTGRLVLAARTTADHLIIVVRDYGVGVDSKSPNGGLGVGLAVIERLAESTIEDGRPGTLVTMRFPRS